MTERLIVTVKVGVDKGDSVNNNLHKINYIKELFAEFDISFKKSFGQNFLINPDICPKMAEACGVDSQSGVLEIGPGVGILTAALASRAKKVVSVEIDRGLIPLLHKTLAGYDNVTVVSGDIMKEDITALVRKHFAGISRVYVCANLPYYITSPVIMRILEEGFSFAGMCVMVQEETAERFCAPEASRKSGAVTLAVRYHGVPEILFKVPRGNFYPAPNVDSAVMRIIPHGSPPVTPKDPRYMFRIIKAAFASRRKTAVNSISAGLSIEKTRVMEFFSVIGIDLNARAENLTLRDFAELSEKLSV